MDMERGDRRGSGPVAAGDQDTGAVRLRSHDPAQAPEQALSPAPATDTRTPIGVACGVIMGQNRYSYNEAFQILAQACSHRNIKLRGLAETTLANAADESATMPCKP